MTDTRALAALAVCLILVAAMPTTAQIGPVVSPASKLPGNLENMVQINPLVIASSSTKSVPALISAKNTLPVIDFEVRSTGGTAPVTFSIVGGAVSMFEMLAAQSGAIVAQPSPAQAAAAEAAAIFERKPAGTVTRMVRFKGATNAASLGNQFAVQIRVRDVLGATATTTVNVLPFAPRIAPLTITRTAHETWPLNLSVQGLGAASVMRVNSLAGCGYSENPRVGYPQTSNVNAGAAGLFRWASFRGYSSGTCSGLQVQISWRFPDTSDFGSPISVTVPPFTFQSEQTYSFANTWALRDLFAFRVQQGHTGVCSGTSGVSDGDHPVGVYESNDDIAISIRSGPLGTECDYVSSAPRLPDGFTLSGIEFVKTEGPNNSPTIVQSGSDTPHYCRIGGSGGTVGGLVKFNLSKGYHVLRSDEVGASQPVWAGFTLQGWERPLSIDGVAWLSGGSGDSNYAVLLSPLYIKLICFITPSNTEFIRLRVNRVEFRGPPGVQFP